VLGRCYCSLGLGKVIYLHGLSLMLFVKVRQILVCTQ